MAKTKKPSDSKAVKLANLVAKKIAKPTHPSNNTWNIQISELIKKSLEAGGKMLVKSLDILKKKNNMAAMDALLKFIEFEISLQEFSHADGVTFNSTLFAIPVNITCAHDLGCSMIEGGLDSFNAFTALMRKHKLIKPSDTLILIPETYTANELVNISYKKVYSLSQSIIESVDEKGHGNFKLSKLGFSEKYRKEELENELPTKLRFVVGLVLSYEEDWNYLDEDTLRDEYDQGTDLVEKYGEHLDAFMEDATESVYSCFNLDPEKSHAQVGVPNLLFEAVTTGMTDKEDFAMHIHLAIGLGEADIEPEETEAILGLFGNTENDTVSEIRVSVLDNNGKLVVGHTRELLMHEEMPEIISDLAEQLKGAGFGKVTVINGLFDAVYCDCCNNPVYFSRESDDNLVLDQTIKHDEEGNEIKEIPMPVLKDLDEFSKKEKTSAKRKVDEMLKKLRQNPLGDNPPSK